MCGKVDKLHQFSLLPLGESRLNDNHGRVLVSGSEIEIFIESILCYKIYPVLLPALVI